MRARHMWKKGAMAAATLLLLGGLRASDRPDDPWIHGIFIGKSPRAVLTVEADAWWRASKLAEKTPGSFVLMGSGESMQPLYAPGTILVLQKLPFDALERGQTALYRNQERRIVAHVLVARTRDGWRVAGLNNRVHDMEPLQSDNFVGVVIAAFKPLASRNVVHLASLR